MKQYLELAEKLLNDCADSDQIVSLIAKLLYKSQTYDYHGIALSEEREGTNCWGFIEGKETCIHLKFGSCVKSYDFTDEFIKKYPDFHKRYLALWDNPKLEEDREYMLQIWRDIIDLKASGDLVVIANMCDRECPTPESIAFYAISQGKFNFTWDELMGGE